MRLVYPGDISLLSAPVRALRIICIAGRQKLVGKAVSTCSRSKGVADGCVGRMSEASVGMKRQNTGMQPKKIMQNLLRSNN